MDLSQHPAKSVSDFGAMASEVSGAVGPVNVAKVLFVDFNVDALHAACSLSNIDLIVILGIGDGG